MTFAWPILLIAVPLVPLGALALWSMGRRRAARVAAFGHLNLMPSATGRRAAVRGRITGAFYLAGLLLLAFALARPTTVVSLPVSQGLVILAFDVSQSMAADDLQPTRMEAAKAAAKDFVAHQPASVVIGVVAFSDSGFSVQAPSNDPATVSAAIDRLQPQRGTSLGQGIMDSLNAIALAESDQTQGYYTNRSPEPTVAPTPVPPGTHTSASIVLLTDGENNERPDPLQAAQAAADRGVRIYPIGIGSEAGTDLKIEGFTIHSQLDPQLLTQIAQVTGGRYFPAQSSGELHAIYDTLDPRIEFKDQSTELTAFLAAFGLVLLLVGGLTSLAWTARLP